MKRLPSALAAGSLAGAISLFPQTANAVPNYCLEDVYDETTNAVSGPLQSAIGDFAARGVEVHVQVFEDSHMLGINSADDASRFVEDVKDICGWRDPDQLEVLVSLNPRAAKLNQKGSADDIDQTEFTAAVNDYSRNLKDGRTPYQQDVAVLLDDLLPTLPVPGSSVTSQPRPRPQTTRPVVPREEPPARDLPDIPWGQVGGAVVLLSAAGYGGGRLRRGGNVNAEFNRGLNELETAKSSVLMAYGDADGLLAALHEDDAPDLRELTGPASDKTAQLSDRIKVLTDEHKSARHSFWPSLDDAEVTTAETVRTAATYVEYANRLKAEVDQVNGYLTGREAQQVSFNTTVDNVRAAATKAQEDQGWNLGGYETELEALGTVRGQVTQQINDKYVEKPCELMNEHEPKAKALQEKIEALPGRRVSADNEYDAQTGTIKADEKLVISAKEVLSGLKVGYDETCVSDISEVDSLLDSDLAALKANNAEYLQYRGVKTLDALELSQAGNGAFNAIHISIGTNAVKPSGRQTKLEDIKADLPQRLKAVHATITDVNTFANRTEKDDVEDDVRDEIIALEERFDEFVGDEVNVDRPEYLGLNASIDIYAQSAAEVAAKARRQRDEMDSLRADVGRLQGSNQRALSSLQSYVMSNSGDIGYDLSQTARGLSLTSHAATGNRAGLRNSVNHLNSEAENIRDLRADAERRVAAAEAERRRIEAARLAAIAAEEARQREIERQRQQAEDERRRQESISSSNSGTTTSADFGGSSGSGTTTSVDF